jgi:hypothetical protein
LTLIKMSVWRDCPSFPNYQCNELGEVFNTKTNRVLTGNVNSRGYVRVFTIVDDKKKLTTKHTLICDAFYGKRPDGASIDHIDRNPSNNIPSNLRYCNHRENNQNKKVPTTSSTGERYIRKYFEKFRIRIRFQKSVFYKIVDTLEEAKKIRDEYLQTHKEEDSIYEKYVNVENNTYRVYIKTKDLKISKYFNNFQDAVQYRNECLKNKIPE